MVREELEEDLAEDVEELEVDSVAVAVEGQVDAADSLEVAEVASAAVVEVDSAEIEAASEVATEEADSEAIEVDLVEDRFRE